MYLESDLHLGQRAADAMSNGIAKVGGRVVVFRISQVKAYVLS